MNILVLGSGGREHALAWKIADSPLIERLYCAPGNAGIAQQAECVPLDLTDHAAVAGFCRDRRIDLVVVGPEAPLVAGVADALRSAGVAVFGPNAAAAQLEGSKGLMVRSYDFPDICDVVLDRPPDTVAGEVGSIPCKDEAPLLAASAQVEPGPPSPALPVVIIGHVVSPIHPRSVEATAPNGPPPCPYGTSSHRMGRTGGNG